MRLLGRRSALAVLLGALLMLGYCSVAVHGTKEATPAPATATPTAAPVPTTAEASEEAADPPKLGLKEKLMAAYEKILNFDVHAQMDKAEAALIVLKETDYQAMFETAKTAIVEGDIREVEPGLLLSYVALVLMAVVPIIVGSYQSLEDSGDEPAEVMTSADAAYFPVQASITLLSLYLLFQLFGKEYVNLLLSGYFFLLGVGAVTMTLRPLGAMLAPKSLQRREFHLSFTETGPTVEAEAKAAKELAAKEEKPNPDAAGADAGVWMDAKFNAADVCCFFVAAAIGAGYLSTKHWILNNVFGMAFAINGVSLLQLGSFAIGATLLSGLFFYDVFWVFGTDVMVTVAKSFDAPIKVIFPKDFLVNGIWATEHAMLGLGDIVLPGVLIALLLRFDQTLRPGSSFYFTTAIFSYILGLVLTVFVMHTFKAAQPALLYLVPLGVATPIFWSVLRGEIFKLFKYHDAPPSAESTKKQQ